MMKSMTGFSKKEASEGSVKAIVELKSLNGKNLEINTRIPRSLNFKEFEIRDIIKNYLQRGSVSLNITIEATAEASAFALNEKAAQECYSSLKKINTKLKIKEPVSMQNLLTFSSLLLVKEETDNSAIEWKLAQAALKEALKSLDKMRSNEGQQISKDIIARMKFISQTIDKVESLGIKKIPAERERLRQRVAQLFEADEIDEHRIQTELVLLADKLDISEECVRMKSHIKFFHETIKGKETPGRKINFLMQEMNREVNTIGSKANDTEISHFVVALKEEIERIREQIQNIE